ncbi:hypothetical protein HY251_17900 [bacterium]|nr:hypothetical protein [bacterium]
MRIRVVNGGNAKIEGILDEVERGAPVVEPLSAITRRSGVGFRHALATREVQDGRDLERVLREARGDERRALIAAAGDAVRRLHDAGFDHADLNLKNVLVRAGPGGPALAVVLDLDRGRLREALTTSARRRNLVRLLRSFWKLFVRAGASAASPRDPFRFARAYARGERERRRELVSWGRSALPALRARAFLWRLLRLVRPEGLS